MSENVSIFERNPDAETDTRCRATPAPLARVRPLSERRRPDTWRTLRTPDGYRPSPRETERAARQCAQDWYQALLVWDVQEVELVPTERGSPRPNSMVVVGIGAFSSRRGGTSSNGGAARYVRTPGPSRYTELEIGSQISSMARSATPDLAMLGGLLERLRGCGGLASLVDERGGWNRDRARALLYARAVLTLAVRLGDAVAETHLPTIARPIE